MFNKWILYRSRISHRLLGNYSLIPLAMCGLLTLCMSALTICMKALASLCMSALLRFAMYCVKKKRQADRVMAHMPRAYTISSLLLSNFIRRSSRNFLKFVSLSIQNPRILVISHLSLMYVTSPKTGRY
jgi:hypothetical protein